MSIPVTPSEYEVDQSISLLRMTVKRFLQFIL